MLPSNTSFNVLRHIGREFEFYLFIGTFSIFQIATSSGKAMAKTHRTEKQEDSSHQSSEAIFPTAANGDTATS